MKRKLTLGLMVFFVGILITACGSKKGSSNNVNATPVGGGITTPVVPAGCTTNCNTTQFGTLQISNPQLFEATFGTAGYTNGAVQPIQPLHTGSSWNLGGFGSSLLNNAVVGCALPALGAWVTTEYLGAANASAECNLGFSGTNGYEQYNNGGYANGGVPTSMPVTMQYNFNQNQLFSVVMIVNNAVQGGNGQRIEFFPRANTNVLYSQSGQLALAPSGNSWVFGRQEGTIGTIL